MRHCQRNALVRQHPAAWRTAGYLFCYSGTCYNRTKFFIVRSPMSADVHYLVSDLLIAVFVILYERGEEMDISDIFITYEENTGKKCSIAELEKVVSWAEEIGFLRSIPQPFEFLKGSPMEKLYQLSEKTKRIMEKRDQRIRSR